MVFDRLRRLVGRSEGDDPEAYRCVNCGDEFERAFRECPECGGPYLAPIEDDSRNA